MANSDQEKESLNESSSENPGERSQTEKESSLRKITKPIEALISGVRKAIKGVWNGVSDVGKKIASTGWEYTKERFFPGYTALSLDLRPANTTTETSSETHGKPQTLEHQCKQWTTHLDVNGDGKTLSSYEIFQKDADGKKKFYEVTPGPYGNPIITAEPDRAFDAPKGVHYIDVKGQKTEPNQKIAGIICEDGPRFSLSSPNAPNFKLDDDGTLHVDDQKWHLVTLFLKDKNRIINYDAYFSKEKPQAVCIRELGDLKEFFKPIQPVA